MFGHDKETPGLGAEIELPTFESQFIGKKIFDASGKFTSIKVLKGASKVLTAEQLHTWSGCHFGRNNHQQWRFGNDPEQYGELSSLY